MQIVVDNLLANYVRSGTGKEILILHGWGDNVASWKDLIADLSKNYEVIALDLPGFGGSEAPRAAWGLSEYATFVAAFLSKAKLQPYAVIAHSNGGAIAIRALSHHLFSAQKLVLLASAGIRSEYKGRKKALRLVTKAGKALTTPLPRSIKKRLRQKVYQTVGSDMLVAEHLQDTFKRVVTDDVRTDARQISIPTLLLYGDTDQATPLRYGELLHKAIPNSKLQVLSGAGHFLYSDKPQEVMAQIEDFLS